MINSFAAPAVPGAIAPPTKAAVPVPMSEPTKMPPDVRLFTPERVTLTGASTSNAVAVEPAVCVEFTVALMSAPADQVSLV